MTNLHFRGAALADFLRDVTLDYAPAPPLSTAEYDGVLWQASGGRFSMSVPDVARYLVEDGRRIAIETADDAAPEEILRILHMTPLAALCFQRGIAALHAAVASGPHGAVLIAGDSSAGKSTLLAALVQRGWRALADDIAVLGDGDGGEVNVIPAYPEILLWADSAKELATPLAANRTASGRTPMMLTGEHFARPEPLRTLVWLGLAEGDAVETTKAEGAERFQFVHRLAYNSRIAEALFDRPRYLGHMGALAALPLHIVRRPSSRWSIVELADAVERVAP